MTRERAPSAGDRVAVRTTAVEGRTVRYLRAGDDGPHVVLLHGGGVDDAGLSWRRAVPALADEYRVCAPDLPGYGGSDPPAGPHCVETYRETVEEFLDDAGIESAALAGLSMGGAVALSLSLARPGRVDRLALLDSYGLGERIPAGRLLYAGAHVPLANAWGWAALGLNRHAARAGLAGVVHDAASLPDAFLDGVVARARRPGSGRSFAAFQRNEVGADGTAATDFTDELASLSPPTLYVHGEDDGLFPPEWSVRARDRTPDARLELLERCGHWPPRECPERVAAVLRRFLS